MRALRELLASHPERLLAFLLAAYALVSAWDFSRRPACIDYYQFWVVGRAVGAKEVRDVYTDAERKRLGEQYWQRAIADASARSRDPSGAPVPTKRLQAARQRQTLETYSTPWLYTLFGLASTGDYDHDQDRFQHASLLAYVAAITILCSLLRFSLAGCALWVAALLQWFNPFVDDLIAGNVNRLQLFLLALFLWIEVRTRFPGRHAAAGALLGAALAFKPNLASVVLALLLGWAFAGEARRLFHAILGLAAGALAAVLASGAYFGSLAPWRDWLREAPKLAAAGSAAAGSAGEGNYSLARLVLDRTGLSLGPWFAVVLLAAALAALVLERRRRVSSPRSPASLPAADREILLVGLGAALSLLSAELAWQHYFVVLVPLAMVLLRPADGDAGAGPWVRAVALLGLTMISLQNVGRLFDLRDPSAHAAVMCGGTLLLLAVGLVDLAWPSAGLARPRAA